jgi:hypothetical protein
MTENYVETLEKNFWRVSTRWTGFWQKITVLIQNGLKLIFYPDRHGRTRIDSMDSVLTENDGFHPKQLKTHFLPWSTWFDPYWLGGLGFDRKWRFWPKTHFLLRSTWFDPYWLGGLGFYGKMQLTREKYIYIFLNFKLFLIFLDFYK